MQRRSSAASAGAGLHKRSPAREVFVRALRVAPLRLLEEARERSQRVWELGVQPADVGRLLGRAVEAHHLRDKRATKWARNTQRSGRETRNE
eukprot:5195259-Pleurochrysis_carterae.AAC.1